MLYIVNQQGIMEWAVMLLSHKYIYFLSQWKCNFQARLLVYNIRTLSDYNHDFVENTFVNY